MLNVDSVARPQTYGSIAAADAFRLNMRMIETTHRPESVPFFMRLAGMPSAAALEPDLLGRIHLTYQSAMHATRAMVYFLPHLDSSELRKRKLQTYVDDEGLAGTGAHHDQLTTAFRNLGARLRLDDEKFGDLERLSGVLDARTAEFVRTVRKLYARSLGPWCTVELLACGWIAALQDSLAVHAPQVHKEPYFTQCARAGVDHPRAANALETTALVLGERPELLDQTVADAWAMARALDLVWDALDDVVTRAALAAA
jgi:hypothetical protein